MTEWFSWLPESIALGVGIVTTFFAMRNKILKDKLESNKSVAENNFLQILLDQKDALEKERNELREKNSELDLEIVELNRKIKSLCTQIAVLKELNRRLNGSIIAVREQLEKLFQTKKPPD